MRPITLSLILAIGLSATPLVSGATQDTTATVKKPPSKAKSIVKKLADTAATAAAGAGVQSLLGKKAGGVANALGAGGVTPCGTGVGASAGSALVGVAKGIVKQVADTGQAASAVPCAQATIPGLPAGIPGLPGGMPGMLGMPNGADAAAAAAALGGSALGGVTGGASPTGGMGAMGAIAGMTPIGLAAGAAPGAIKGIKGVLGGKPQDKLAMVRELGKGKLEFKSVKFIEGTLELEPGFEASFTAFAEAIALVEGTYYMHVSAESSRQKGAAPDTVLSRKRVAKVWALMAANGVSDQKVIAVNELPAALSADRKPPKPGDTKVEIIKFEKQQ